MTALTREAIVEAAARAQYEHDRATRGGDGPFEWPEWDDLPVFEQAICRQFVFPVVLATLDALMPLVEHFKYWAEVNESIAENANDKDEHERTLTAYATSAANYAAAKYVLGVLKP